MFPKILCAVEAQQPLGEGWGLRPLTEVGRSLIFCTDHHPPEIQLLSPGIAAVTPSTA